MVEPQGLPYPRPTAEQHPGQTGQGPQVPVGGMLQGKGGLGHLGSQEPWTWNYKLVAELKSCRVH